MSDCVLTTLLAVGEGASGSQAVPGFVGTKKN